MTPKIIYIVVREVRDLCHHVVNVEERLQFIYFFCTLKFWHQNVWLGLGKDPDHLGQNKYATCTCPILSAHYVS